MGVVWLAEHRTLRTEVVVKFLNDEMAARADAARQVAREASAAARVRSPHIVQVLDHGVTASGLPFIVMERLMGQDMKRYLERQDVLSPEQAVAVVYQVAQALAKTHASGFVHRDVKPSNVFLCEEVPEPFFKLLDFGLAVRPNPGDHSTTAASLSAGTPETMSPEQILGLGVDARSDVWSLGVLAFQCLTGRRPFEGESVGAVALAIHTLPIPRMTGIRPELPSTVDAWFERACARDVGQRLASALEAAATLGQALSVDAGRARFGPAPAPPEAQPVTAPIASDFTETRAWESSRVAPMGNHGAKRGAAATLIAALLATGVWVGVNRPRNTEAHGHRGTPEAEEPELARSTRPARFEGASAAPADRRDPRSTHREDPERARPGGATAPREVRAEAVAPGGRATRNPQPPASSESVATPNPRLEATPSAGSLYELPDERR
ncbi:MAG: protein kinase [Myxococcales bacterium]|nr:protein kinase [Myxococcales bacterium]